MTEVFELGSPRTEKDRLLNVEQVRERLGIGRSTVYKMIEEGKLKGFKVCGTRGLRVRLSVVEAYIRKKEASYGAH
jgi:excisionase family DNA binding protein